MGITHILVVNHNIGDLFKHNNIFWGKTNSFKCDLGIFFSSRTHFYMWIFNLGLHSGDKIFP